MCVKAPEFGISVAVRDEVGDESIGGLRGKTQERAERGPIRGEHPFEARPGPPDGLVERELPRRLAGAPGRQLEIGEDRSVGVVDDAFLSQGLQAQLLAVSGVASPHAVEAEILHGQTRAARALMGGRGMGAFLSQARPVAPARAIATSKAKIGFMEDPSTRKVQVSSPVAKTRVYEGA